MIMVFIMIVSTVSPAFAKQKEEENGHDQQMSLILFGSKDYKGSLSHSSDEYKALEALENAVALCIDQYNDSYKKELKKLKKMHIHGLPGSLDEINFSGNQHHRRYTHKGWKYVYPDDKGHWNIRKTILLQTVNKVFKFQSCAGEWKFLGLKKDYGFDKQCEAFASFLYYIHILVDIPKSGMNEGYSDMIKLALPNPTEDAPDIYYELERILPVVFEAQISDPSYVGLITDIKLQAGDARQFVRDTPELKDNYDQYKEYANNLLKKLGSKISFLLKKEKFFKDVFY